MRRGTSLLEMAVAIAVAVALYLALDAQLDQQRRMVALMRDKLAARQAAALAGRMLIADPAARARLERDGLPGWKVRVERIGADGPGVARLRVAVAARSGNARDAVELVLGE